MAYSKRTEASKIGDIVSSWVEGLRPVQARYDAVAEAWITLLPSGLRAHCQVTGLVNGALKVAVDSSSYMYELQLCKAALLEELDRLCPSARIRRIDVGMAR